MKKFLLFLTVALSLQLSAQTSWELQHPKPGPWSYTSIYAFDSLHAFITGGSGVLETRDGAKSWRYIKTPLPNNEEPYLKCIIFADNLHGWAVGERGTIIHTQDGGKTWQSQKSVYPEYMSIVSITASHSNYAWAIRDTSIGIGQVNRRSRFLRTTNGGKDWVEDPILHTRLYSIDFSDSLQGWSVGENGVILHTMNGGVSWDSVTVAGLEEKTLRKVYCDSQKVVIAGEFLTALSEDNGITWQVISDYPFSTPTGLSFQVNKGIISWADARSHITGDGGKTWKAISRPDSILPSKIASVGGDISYCPDGSVWRAGSIGVILRSLDGGKSWQSMTSILEDLEHISFGDLLNGWATGKASTLLKTTDGGQNWISIGKKSDSITYYAIDFIDKDRGWISQSRNKLRFLRKTINGGKSWENIYHDTTLLIRQMHFFNDNQGAAAIYKSEQNYLSRTEDGGKTWKLNENLNNKFYSLQFISSTDGWASGLYLYHTSDGGTTWKEVSTPVSGENIYSVSFLDSLRGWIAGRGNTSGSFLYYTPDGGKTWEDKKNHPLFDADLKVIFSDSLNGVVLRYGFGGAGILETNDGGKTWSFGGASALVSELIVKNNNYWAVGDNGVILHKSLGTTSVTEKEKLYAFAAYSVYPNPNHGRLTLLIHLADPPQEDIGIYDIMGERVGFISPAGFTSDGLGSWKVDINLTGFPPGSYILKSSYGEAKIILQK